MAFFDHFAASFQDRKDAGQQLAEALLHLKNEQPIVYALPRGGVPVAFEVAKALKAPLDLLMVRKIGAPGHEELGIGAIVDGPKPQMVLNKDTVRMLNPSKEYIEATKQRQLKEIQRQRAIYLKNHPQQSPEGRCAIVVDDGIATGGTAKVAIKALKAQKARRIVLAVPVAARDTIEALKSEGIENVCLYAPVHFSAVGLHYKRFGQTDDAEVVHCVENSRKWLEN